MITIEFERKEGKIYDKLTGQEVDNALLSTFPVDYEPDHMSGKINIPTSLLVTEEGGGLKIIRTKVYPPTDSSQYRAPNIQEERKLEPLIPGKTSLVIEEGEKTDFNAEKLEDLTYDDVFVDPTLTTAYTKAEELERFRRAQAEQWLHVLGFVSRPNKNGSVHKWYHPMFGDDKADNCLLFDVETDTIESLGVKIFRLGARLGTRGLKLQIKATLEQH